MTNPLAEATTPELQDVLDALDDPDCRQLVRHLDEPASAEELRAETDIPRSTLYRKLDLLSEAGLVREYTELRRDGNHTTQYERSFGEVCVTFEDGEFTATIRRPDRSPDEQLSDLWSEVRTETRGE